MRVSRPVILAFSVGLLLGGAGMRTFVSLERRPVVAAQATSGPPGEVRTPDESDVMDEAAHRSKARMASPAQDPEGAAFRANIRARVAEALAEGRRGHEVGAYLDELEATARRQGRVTALEILPGLAVIERAFPDDMERSVAFTRRMERVARELGTSDDGARPTTAIAPEILVTTMANTAQGPARDQLVRKALSAIDRLPVEEQPAAFAAVSRATAPGAPAAPPVSLDGLLEQVRSAAGGEARRSLVRSFVEIASNLPPEEQERRFRQLEEATAGH